MNKYKAFKNLTKEGKRSIFLTDEEKRVMRSEILDFMKSHPASVSSEKAFSFGYIFQYSTVRYASVFAAFAIITTFGVSSAASSALPGDVLYPVKVGVNEKVLGFLQVSDQAKAEYSLQLVQTRLDELEKVTVNKSLNDTTNTQIQNLIDDNINNVNKYSAKIEHNNNPSASLNISSDLEASLNAHSQVLDQLSKQETDGSSNNLNKIISNVKSKISDTQKDREDSENKAIEDDPSGLKDTAQNSINNANNLLENVNDFIDSKQSAISSDSYQSAKDNLDIASQQLDEATSDFSNGDYKSAISLSQQAARSAKETKINFQASVNLNIEVPQISQHGWQKNSHHQGRDNSNNKGGD